MRPSLFDSPDLDVINPNGGVHQKTEPALHGMGKTLGSVTRHQSAIQTQAHFIAFSHQNQFMPVGVRLPGHHDLFGLKKRGEISGQGFFAFEIALAAGADLQIHHPRFVIAQGDVFLR